MTPSLELTLKCLELLRREELEWKMRVEAAFPAKLAEVYPTTLADYKKAREQYAEMEKFYMGVYAAEYAEDIRRLNLQMGSGLEDQPT